MTSTEIQFELIKEIGFHGRNSQVYRAKDIQTENEIVIKKIPKVKLTHPDKFYDEARRLNISEHQHVVPVKFASQDADHIYLAMPFYVRGSLKDLIDARFLTVRQIVRYALQFLSGLNNIHVKNLIHFDIKPDNILISNTDEAVVADFGLAQTMDLFGLSETDKAYNKHLPPEYFMTSKHSMLYDIYSSGLTLYRMCNGNQHFYDQFGKLTTRDEIKHAIINNQFPDRQSYKYHIPKKIRNIIKKCLQIDVAKRFQTVLELLNDLSKVDEILDWQYSSTVDTEEWSHENDTRIITIYLKKLVNLKYESVTTKLNKSSGKITRISEGCNKNIEPDNVENLIIHLLEQYG